MPTDREIAANADPSLQQHFLVSGDKLSMLISAAGIRPETMSSKSELVSAPLLENCRGREV